MRLLEFTLTLTLLARAWWPVRGFSAFHFLPAGAALLQVLVEGYRWQMIPLYGLAVLGGLAGFLGRRAPAGSDTSGRRMLGITAATLVTVFAAAIPLVLPIPRPFPPTGPFPIGTRTLHLVDASRTDPYAAEPGSPREILVQLWYPAVEIGRPERAPWMPDAELIAPEVAKTLALPAFFLDHLVYARTDSFLDLPVEQNDAGWPVVLFSHGYTGFRAQNTFQVQELASHGFIVAAVEHTYASAMTVFPDGRTAPPNPEALPDGVSDAEYEAAAKRLLVQWAGDLAFTLETLDEMDADPGSWLSGSLDLSKLGATGHSTGGGAAVQFCSEEPRCTAGLAMDPWLVPVQDEVLEAGLDRPFLVMFSETWSSDLNTDRFRTLADGYPGALYVFTVLGSAHYDFSDLPQLSPLSPYLGVKGPIDGDTMFRIVNEYSVDFFNSTLRGMSFTMAYSGAGGFPEVRFSAPGQ